MILDFTIQQQKRFWTKVEQNKSNEECWSYLGARDRDNYGIFGKINGKNMRAHRVAFVLAYNTDIPNGLLCCHKCDNPSCVNPNHLFLGTFTDNNRDREVKGRGRKQSGSLGSNAKFTEEQVNNIRLDTRSQYAIACEYKVVQPTIWKIKHYKTWKTIK